MAKSYLMAIDAGSGSVRAILFDTLGNQISSVSREWVHPTDPRFPDSMDFDCIRNWKLICECTNEVITKTKIDPNDIAAVSSTCMREAIVLYDKDMHEIWACANVDGRSKDEVKQLIDFDPELEREIYTITGEVYALGTLPRLLWVKNKMPEVYKQTTYVGMINDWITFKLSNVLAVEPSNGSTTGIIELKTRDWNREIPAKVGLKSDIFPKIIESGEVLGKVTPKAANEVGLSVGTLVVAGGGDAQLGCIGVGAVSDGDASLFGGSHWQYEINTSSPKVDPDCAIRVNCHAIPNIWQYEAIAFNPGLVMRWYRDAFCQQEKEIAYKTNRDVYDLMNEKAKGIPAGSNGMMACFSDTMNFINWVHSAPTFTNFGLDADKFNKYTFYRSLMENAAFVSRSHMEAVSELSGKKIDSLTFAGGASKSPLWCQIIADIMGVKVKVPVVNEATALGCAILAGVGAKIYNNVEDAAKKLVKIKEVYTPNPENKNIYDQLYNRWKTVYKAQLDLVRSGVTTSMWKAPGL